jgi:hypothetical protein
MFRRLSLSVTLGALMLTASCAEAPKEEEPAAAPAAAPVEEGPFYELTKDEITSHPDWTSKNITFKGVKIGDKGAATIEKALGKGDKEKLVEGIGEHYRTVYGQSSFSIYTYKNTAELQKIEIYGRMADQIADPKFKKLLSTGDLKYMREAFGMEDKAEVNSNTTGMEYIYDSKGFRFAEYNLPGQKVRSLIFLKIVKKAPETK